jgi:dTDP-4-dehydrorhamnose 3,5-epimerase
VELSGENHRQFWLPPGMAHGFLVTGESADFLYKTTDYYAPAAEGCVRWDDPTVNIDWPDVGMVPLVSGKDATGQAFAQAPAFG